MGPEIGPVQQYSFQNISMSSVELANTDAQDQQMDCLDVMGKCQSFVRKDPLTSAYGDVEWSLHDKLAVHKCQPSEEERERTSMRERAGSATSVGESEHFQERHEPPKPPVSQHFSFAPTTLFVEGCKPHQIGNNVLDFLTSAVVASVTKVKAQKYSIKAEVFVEAVPCTIKVRVYNHEGKYAVEVQRRSGDAFVVQSTYLLLAAFLGTHCGGLCGMHPDAPLAQPTLPELEPGKEGTEVPSVEALTPLLTMATVAGLQAEAATGLVEVVKGGRASAAALFLAPDQVASALTVLLESECLDMVYPAARCVSSLAAFGDADSILAHHGLLQKIALHAVAELRTAQGLVGTALAQAVADAVHCCAGSLTAAAARDLQQVLYDATNDEMLKANVVACTYLEQAGLNTKLVV